jgi:arylsulfatase A-like enzyme
MRLLARRFMAEPIFLNPASIWLGPISAAIVFAPLIGIAWLAGRRGGRERALSWAVAVAAFLAAFDVLMLVPRVHPLALAALAGGVAAQATWLARNHRSVFQRALTRGTLLLATVSAVGGVLFRGDGGEGTGLRSLAAPEEAPNVLLLVLDTVRALELSVYGYERSTSPRLVEIAREGVRFDRAVATAPWTLPTHATLFTGKFQRDLSVGWTTPLDSVPPTLSEHFLASGYATGGFIANLRYGSREYGLGRGFETYRDYALTGSQMMGSTMLGRRVIGLYNDWRNRYVLVGRKDAERVVDEFLAWQGSDGKRPFFAFLNFFDAHEPYAPDAPHDLRFAPREPPTRALEMGRKHPPDELQGLVDAYDGAIASLDEQLGRLFDALRQRGVLDNTIVVVTADHGEEFAEHGHVSHGNGLHFPALHVPLIVRWPAGRVPAGAVVSEPVSLADVPATIVELAATRQPSELSGTSLVPLWSGSSVPNRSPVLSELFWVANQPEWYPVAGGNLRSLVRGRYHLIAGPGTREELYDIVDDPFERRDLRNEPALADTLAALRVALQQFPDADRKGR